MITPLRKALLEQIIRPDEGSLSPEHAAYILKLGFPPSTHARYEALAAKVGQAAMPAEERAELEDLVLLNTLLATMKSKARLSLRQHNSAA